jgi:hypothetical protein
MDKHTPTAIEPTYSRRCGYWFRILGTIGGVFAILFLFGIWLTDSKDFYSKMDIDIANFAVFHFFLILGLICMVGTELVLLTQKKLTTEPGNFWKVFGMYAGSNWLMNLSSVGKNGSVVSVVVGAFFAAICTFIPAAIVTMPDDYDGCCACLKCLKPWKVEQVMPFYNSGFPPQYPVQVAPMYQQQKA